MQIHLHKQGASKKYVVLFFILTVLGFPVSLLPLCLYDQRRAKRVFGKVRQALNLGEYGFVATSAYSLLDGVMTVGINHEAKEIVVVDDARCVRFKPEEITHVAEARDGSAMFYFSDPNLPVLHVRSPATEIDAHTLGSHLMRVCEHLNGQRAFTPQ